MISGYHGGKGARRKGAMAVMQEFTLESLYEAHAKVAYWAAYGVLRDRELAADAMQTAFLSAHRNMPLLHSMSLEQCRAWIYRCAVNAGIDILRRNKRAIPTEDAGVGEADDAPGPEMVVERNEAREAVRGALDSLPEKYKAPLYLYYFADMDYRQIADLLKINEGTLKSRMSRGRNMLGEVLKKGGGARA